MNFVRIFRVFLLVFCSLAVISGCKTPKADTASLVRDVELYNRDLLFQRYDVAAKRISASGRMAWLEAMRKLGLRFAEIEVVNTETCTESKEDAPACVKVLSQMQWYSNDTPTLHTSRVLATWQFDKESGAWIIVEQDQL